MYIVPIQPAATSVGLWLGFEGKTPPAAVSLSLRGAGTNGQRRDITPSWARYAENIDFWTARPRLTELQPNVRYTAHWDRSNHNTDATFRTLPMRLPSVAESEHFTVLVGSCFSIQTGNTSGVAHAVRKLPTHRAPHVKLLCGDQVYLDLPVTEDLPHNLAKLRKKLFEKYWRNWSHGFSADGEGFGAFLRQGTNVFTSDDHEYWNNFPAAQAHLPITWRRGSRSNYAQASREAFRAFQSEYPLGNPAGTSAVQRVRVGSPGHPGHLDIVTLDGRYFRDDTKDLAHKREDLDFVTNWLTTLRGPGVLVLSQPLFAEPANRFKRRWYDAWLSNYEDYEPLARALDRAPHDVMVISGDIHRARYAVAKGASSKNTVHEIVSSPLSLIPTGKHEKEDAHTRFPDPAISGVSPRTVRTDIPGTLGNNFATISFSTLQDAINAEFVYWEITDGSSSPARSVDSLKLQLR